MKSFEDPWEGVTGDPSVANEFAVNNYKSLSNYQSLQKKSNSIAYHFVHEGSCCDEWRITYINTLENIADLLTKPLGGKKRKYFVRKILHWL